MTFVFTSLALWPLPQQAIWFVYLHSFIVCECMLFMGKGTCRGTQWRRENSRWESPSTLPCGSWTLNSAILAGLLFSKLGKKKKMTPRTQKFLTVNELYFPTPKFELWFDNFVVLICEFIYKISMSSVVVHACYPSTWKIKKRSSLGYIV